MTQTLSFHLPSNSGSASVLTPAIQKEVTDAVLAAIAIASGGQAPSNMTIVPTFVTSSSDGSITISFLIDATLSKNVNTTISISELTYAADPTGSIANAVKAATGGNIVNGVAVSLTRIAQYAAASVCALVNATAPISTLISRISIATQINASSIIATGVCGIVDGGATISDVYRINIVGNDNAIAGGSDGSGMSDLLVNGGLAAFFGAIIAFCVMYVSLIRRAKSARATAAAATTSTTTTKANKLTTGPLAAPRGEKSTNQLIHHQNPMNRGKQKQAQLSTKNDSVGKSKIAVNTNASDTTLMFENPLPRRRSRGDLLNRIV